MTNNLKEKHPKSHDKIMNLNLAIRLRATDKLQWKRFEESMINQFSVKIANSFKLL